MARTNRDQMREAYGSGVPIAEIARRFGISADACRYIVNDEYREKKRRANREARAASRRARGLKASGFPSGLPDDEWQVYDGGDAWVATPAERFAGLSAADRQRIINRIRKTGSAISQRKPKPEATADRRNNRVDDVAEELPVQPAVELMMRRYLSGDVSALREYLESIGRAELPVPCLLIGGQ